MNKNKAHIKMFKYFRVVKGWLALLFILMIVSAMIDVFNPIISANLITYLTNFSYHKAITFALLLLGISIIKVLITRITDVVFFNKIKLKVSFDIRKDMLENIFQMKTINFDNHTSGEFGQKVKEDPENISTILSVVQYSFVSMITDIIILCYTFFLNFFLGFVYLIYIFAIYFYEKRAFAKYEEIYKDFNKLNEQNGTLLNESMRGIRDIKKLNITNPILQLMTNSLNETTKKDAEKNIRQGKIWNVVELLKAVVTVTVIIIGIYLVSVNQLSSKNLILIFMYRTNIFDLVLCYTSIKEYYAKYKVSSSRIFSLASEKEYPKEKFGKIEIKESRGKIEIKDLSFSYGEKYVLKNLNLTINPNDTIGIVGYSGSGKTTLFSLLTKSYDIEDHKIFIDDIDINTLTKNSIRNNISVISQDPYLFNLSVEENLKLVGSHITKEDMIEACKIAQIHDDIEKLPKKYKTLIGEGGVSLSGGQKQRLAIARALLKKSKIILFDEATSALDNITQNEIQKAINTITKDYTIIIIAHRLSTIKECNRIFILENGKIENSGTHEELLKKSQTYQKLYEKENA